MVRALRWVGRAIPCGAQCSRRQPRLALEAKEVRSLGLRLSHLAFALGSRPREPIVGVGSNTDGGGDTTWSIRAVNWIRLTRTSLQPCASTTEASSRQHIHLRTFLTQLHPCLVVERVAMRHTVRPIACRIPRSILQRCQLGSTARIRPSGGFRPTTLRRVRLLRSQ